jgi:hypothetical protein
MNVCTSLHRTQPGLARTLASLGAVLLALNACTLPAIRRTTDGSPEDTSVPMDAVATDDTRVMSDRPLNTETGSGMCDAGLTPCGDLSVCTDINTDPRNCGACNSLCAAIRNSVPTCNQGHCDFTCINGTVRRDNQCVRNCASDQYCRDGECMPGSGCTSVRLLDVPWAELSAQLMGCNAQTFNSPGPFTWIECTAAAHRRCRAMSAGANWGYGPIRATGATATIACVYTPSPSSSEPLATLTAVGANCTDAMPQHLDCPRASAAVCAVRMMGASGWGPLEHGNSPPNSRMDIGCIPSTLGTVVRGIAHAVVTAVGASTGRICDPSTAARSVYCTETAHTLCANRGYLTGVGPIGGSLMAGWDFVCLNGAVSVM